MATSFCDPTKKSSNAACNFPDPNVLDLRKGTNPQFLAHQANRVRFQRVAQLNKEIDECDEDAGRCAWTPAKGPGDHRIPQHITNQPTYNAKGEYVQGHLDVERKSHTDYAASTHQGRMKGNERNMRFFRDTQRDERQCLQYGTRCGALKMDGQPKALNKNDKMVYGLSAKFYNGAKWKTIGSEPSWANEKDALRTKELRGTRTLGGSERNKRESSQPKGDQYGTVDRSTLGYEDM